MRSRLFTTQTTGSAPGLTNVIGARTVITMLVLAVALCLGALVYVEHSNSLVIQNDMRLALELDNIASRFDHADGSIYRVMVDKAASADRTDAPRRLAAVEQSIRAIQSELLNERANVSVSDRIRLDRAVEQLAKYADAVDVMSLMLELDFKSSVTMLHPFRSNADHVLHDIKSIAKSGVQDARRHAKATALHTRLLVIIVSIAVLVVAACSYVWVTLATRRGVQLRKEVSLRNEAEREALLLARTDALTGLANRRVFVAELETAISQAGNEERSLAIALIDLDGFKGANDVHGHAAGDAVLHATASRLKKIFGDYGQVARLGGDEFAVFVDMQRGSLDVQALAHRASEALKQPFVWQNNTIQIGGSIGISLFPQDGRELGELLHAADIAMYEVKRAGKAGVRLFTPEMELERLERRQMEQELRIGIRNGDIRPFYQPIIGFTDQAPCGFEVLARWYHPRLGILTPDRFIRLAETTSQITDLTKVLLSQVCHDMKQMPNHLYVSINISPSQLEDLSLADSLIEIIRGHDLSPSRFEIEITEDAIMNDGETVEAILNTFRSAGMAIALDDFGTGYSSLSNLRKLKFDKVKIDRSFTASLTNSVESGKLVDAIIALAYSFGMKVTAEGIEDTETAEFLNRKGCTQGQGYLFGRPESLSVAMGSLLLSCPLAA